MDIMKYAIFFMLLLVNLSFAYELSLSTDQVKVQAGNSTSVIVSILTDKDDKISLAIANEKPWMTISNSQYILQSGSKKDAIFYLSPYNTTQPGLYKTDIIFNSLITGEIKSVPLIVSILPAPVIPPAPVEIRKSVGIKEVSILGDPKPFGVVTIETAYKNTGEVILNSIPLKVEVWSPSKKIFSNEKIVEKIFIDQTQQYRVNLKLPKQAEQGRYRVVVSMYGNTVNKYFDVEGVPILSRKDESLSSATWYNKNIIVKNEGNIITGMTVSDRISSFESIFYKGEKPKEVKNDVYTWEINNLKPGEYRQLQYRIDYSPLYILSAFLVMFAWFIIIRSRAFSIKKHILESKSVNENEEFTVTLNLKNRTGEKVNKIVVHDFVPKIFKFKHVQGPHPQKTALKGDLSLEWHLQDINNHEERVLTYKLIPIIGVESGMTLPNAKVVFEKHKRNVEKQSNSARIGIVKKKPVEEE